MIRNTSSTITESVPLPPEIIAGRLVDVVVVPSSMAVGVLMVVEAVVNVGTNVPFGPRPNINDVARRPATFDTRPEIAANMYNIQFHLLHLHTHARAYISSLSVLCFGIRC